MKQITTSIDIYRLNESGEKEYISKGIHNANTYNNRIGLVEELFGLQRQENRHKPFKNFECFKLDLVKRWGPYKITEITLAPGYSSAKESTETRIKTTYGSRNNKRALWFDIGRGGAQINTLTDQIQGTYNFSTTLYDCIPFRLTETPLENAQNTYGLGLKIKFVNSTSGSNAAIERYAYYHKRVTSFEAIIDGPEDTQFFDPNNANVDYTDTVFIDPANIGSKDITVAIKATGNISTEEVTEFYQFLNGTSAGAFVNEIGFVSSPVMDTDPEGTDTKIDNPLASWEHGELFAHLESNRFDMSGSKSNVTIEYTFYFN